MARRTVLVLTVVDGERTVVAVGSGAAVRLRARLHAARLDAELAGGLSPDTDRLRAVRAASLLAPENRRRLAGYWRNIIARARRPQLPADPRAVLVRARVLAAETEIGELIAALSGPRPVDAGGLAAATLLLTEGSSPLYRRGAADVRGAVRRVTEKLEPRLSPIW